jgi:hypothetical protein
VVPAVLKEDIGFIFKSQARQEFPCWLFLDCLTLEGKNTCVPLKHQEPQTQ